MFNEDRVNIFWQQLKDNDGKIYCGGIGNFSIINNANYLFVDFNYLYNFENFTAQRGDLMFGYYPSSKSLIEAIMVDGLAGYSIENIIKINSLYGYAINLYKKNANFLEVYRDLGFINIKEIFKKRKEKIIF